MFPLAFILQQINMENQAYSVWSGIHNNDLSDTSLIS